MATKVLVVIASVAVVALIVGAVMVFGNSDNGSATNSPSPTASTANSSGGGTLQSTDETVGTGVEAVAGQSVSVNYTGTLQNGTVFDSTAKEGGQPFTFTLGAGQVIKGWDQGVVGMKVGGKRKLVIPPDLAYGSQGAGSSIPPNATLTFEIELLSVSNPSPSPAN